MHPLFGYHVPVDGTEHRDGCGWLRLFPFAEDSEKSFPLWFLGLFLHTFLYDYRYLPCHLLVEGLLLIEQFDDAAHLLFLVFEKMTHAVYAPCRIKRFEPTQHTVHRHTLSMVMF